MPLDELTGILRGALGGEVLIESESPSGLKVGVGGNLAVAFSLDDRGRLLCQGIIGQLPNPPAARAERLRRLLQWNLPRLRFQREAVAIDPETGNLILWRRLTQPSPSNPRAFLAAFEAFLNSLETWQIRLKRVGL
jgi:hypothetical protein